MGDFLAFQAGRKSRKEGTESKSDTPVDEAAQAKRQAMRHQKVLNGIDELEIWLKDLLRNGLINIPERAYTLFDGIAAVWSTPRLPDSPTG